MHPGQSRQLHGLIDPLGPRNLPIDFLQGDDIRLYGLDHACDPHQIELAVDAFAIMDVVTQDAQPDGLPAFRPNKYDPSRAHLAVFNWEKKPKVPVDPGDFLKAEDRYRLMNPKDFFGMAVLAGT